MKIPVPLEREIQKTGKAIMESRGILMFRNNTGMVVVPAKDGRKSRVVRYGLGVGSSDLVGTLPGGRTIAAEVKRPPENPTEDQYNWLDRVRLQGGFAFWFSDLGTLEILLNVAMSPGVRESIRFDRVTHQQIIYRTD